MLEFDKDEAPAEVRKKKVELVSRRTLESAPETEFQGKPSTGWEKLKGRTRWYAGRGRSTRRRPQGATKGAGKGKPQKGRGRGVGR